MNTKIGTLVLAIILGMLISTGLSAQKYGHLNVGNLLEQLEEVSVADSLLVLYRDSLVNEGRIKVEKFQREATQFLEKRELGEMTPKEEQEIGTRLQKEEQELAQYEQLVMQLVAGKRNAFLNPILERLNEVLQKIGKEHGYMMIFDTSVANTVLYVQESDDVLPLVMAELKK